MQSTRSGELKVTATKEEVGIVKLNNIGDKVVWFSVGELSEDTTSLLIKVAGDITLLNAVAVLNPTEFQSAFKKSSKYISEGKVAGVYENVSENNPQVQFSKLNDDQYKVIVQGIEEPSTLVFTQSYDQKWQLNGQSSFPIYSIFNGFMIDRDGEYLVEYSPHRYLKYGLAVSLTTLLGLLGLLLWKKFKKHG